MGNDANNRCRIKLSNIRIRGMVMVMVRGRVRVRGRVMVMVRGRGRVRGRAMIISKEGT
jgi:hypothetical protein